MKKQQQQYAESPEQRVCGPKQPSDFSARSQRGVAHCMFAMARGLFGSVIAASVIACHAGPPPRAVAPTGPVADGAASSVAQTPSSADDMGFDVRVSLLSDDFADTPLARVGDEEVIRVRDLLGALTIVHGAADKKEEKPMAAHGAEQEQGGQVEAGSKDFMAVLGRLINTRLMYLEAKTMGLDELENVEKALAAQRTVMLREMLRARVVEGCQADPDEVEKFYRDAVKQWKVASVLFKAQADAEAFLKEVEGGASFAEAALRAVRDEKATGNEDVDFMPRDVMLPQILSAVEDMQVGKGARMVRVPMGFAVLHLQGVRYPEGDEGARAAATSASLKRARFAANRQYFDELGERYTKTHRELFESLDFEAKEPGYAALIKDERALVEIEDEDPITVGEFAERLGSKFFHGIDGAIRDKKLNGKKYDVLRGMLYERLYLKQANSERIGDTPEYARRVKDYEVSALVSTFIEKVVVPDIKVLEKDSRAHYDANLDAYSYPEFFKLRSLGFESAQAAQDALAKLNAGTEYQWVAENAEGRLSPELRENELQGNTLSATRLDRAMTEALRGAQTGDYRIYEPGDGVSYVVHVVNYTEAKPRAYAEVRGAIAKDLFGKAINTSMQEWAGKLRGAYGVDVFVQGSAID